MTELAIKLICIKSFCTPPKKVWFTVGKIYDAEILIGNVTSKVLIRCDDGLLRITDPENFIKLEDWREEQLNKLID